MGSKEGTTVALMRPDLEPLGVGRTGALGVIPPETHLLPENISNWNKPKLLVLRVAYGIYTGKFHSTSSTEEVL